MDRGNRRLQYLIVFSVASSAVAAGVSLSWGTPVLPKIIANQEIDFPLSDEGISWIMAIHSIGFIIGGSTSQLISDGFGRRIAILGSSVPMFIGTMLTIFARNAWILSSGRLLWGIGTGITIVSSLYIAEIADKEIRGRLALTNRFMLSFGCLLVIVVGAFVSYQTLNYMMLALPIIFFVACWWIPESPYFLLKEGKTEPARKTLRMLSGVQDEYVLDEKVSQMKSHVKIEMNRSSTLKEFLTGERYRKAIFIVAALKIPQVMSGSNVIQAYLGLILLESKSGLNITTALIIFGVIRFLLGIMSSVLVDRLGRRPLLVYSFFGTGFFLGVIAVYFRFQDTHGSSYPYNLIPFVCIIFSTIISVLGYESVAFLVPAELFPLNVKSIAIAAVSLVGGLTNFVSVKSYQLIKDLAGLRGVFAVYAVSAFVGSLCCYFFVPETKGKSLKEIQIELNGNIYDEEENIKLNDIAVNNKEDE